MSEITIIEANLADTTHREAVVSLVDAYAQDPIEGGEPLPDDVQSRLGEGLASHPTTVVMLAMDGDDAVGCAICFVGFTTFAAKPLINIHDLIVLSDYRGKGIGSKLLEAVADKAKASGCCKVTLEVRSQNTDARRLYERRGFTDAGGQPTQFLERRV